MEKLRPNNRPILVAGFVAGATAGLLLAPKPGKVTRRFARQGGAKYLGAAKEAYYNRGIAYNDLGEPQRAIEDLNEAVRYAVGTAITSPADPVIAKLLPG